MAYIRGITEIVLNTHDQQASLGFYQDVLGLEFMAHPSRPGPIFLRMRPTSTSSTFESGSWPPS